MDAERPGGQDLPPTASDEGGRPTTLYRVDGYWDLGEGDDDPLGESRTYLDPAEAQRVLGGSEDGFAAYRLVVEAAPEGVSLVVSPYSSLVSVMWDTRRHERPEWWACPREPVCGHSAVVHDPGGSMRCQADGCPCGESALPG